MIPYVDTRLEEWAQWSRMRSDGDYGFGGGGFGYAEPMPSYQAGCVKTFSPERCLQTESGIAWLGLENWSIGQCTIVRYRDHPEWSAQLQADFLRLSLRSYWRRLETGHALLLTYFIDRAFGLVPQTEALRLRRRVRAESL